MTVSYTKDVATCGSKGTFLKLLRRWRGSIYKLIWQDVLLFLASYYLVSFTYRYALNEEQQDTFEAFVHYCNSYLTVIPLSFVLGFFVSQVMKRWWDQFATIPWPDTCAILVSALVHGHDEHGRLMRRSIVRYMCLCQTMVFINRAAAVRRRFPSKQELIKVGMLTESEEHVFANMDRKYPEHKKHWMPIVWAASIVTRARKEGRIRGDQFMVRIIDELNQFRGSCGKLYQYESVTIPLMYTQVVTLAVYSYFISSVFGKQWTKESDEYGYYNVVDLYFPFFPIMEFFFFMGWLRVAESMMNPFGENDDDFETNWIIDRNMHVSRQIVDDMHHEFPELVKDLWWDGISPNPLPDALSTKTATSFASRSVLDKNQDSVADMPADIIDDLLKHIASDDNLEANEASKAHVSFSQNVQEFSLQFANEVEPQPEEENVDEETLIYDEASTEKEPSDDDDDDLFERLVAERELESLARQRRQIIETVMNATRMLTEQADEEFATSSNTSEGTPVSEVNLNEQDLDKLILETEDPHQLQKQNIKKEDQDDVGVQPDTIEYWNLEQEKDDISDEHTKSHKNQANKDKEH